ncbi:hypothetical protein DICVIV_09968 [Dictyocaulus viviparus]|uniref:Uncharacterized protein n=1 Tax=Dictyocaulus viviparus TaxID=29172 RepID=A0A0D8XJU3_DICVI|nr:hypothetical protein DICVIV_09968 [Dictyocaulus viviparus]
MHAVSMENTKMLVDMEETKGSWSRYIVKFTVNLEFVARIEGPKWIKNDVIISERLSTAHTGYTYLSVCTEL